MKSVLFSTLFIGLSFLGVSQDIEQMKKSKPFQLTGGVSLQGQVYGIDGAPARQPATSYVLNGSPTISIYGFQLPFSFTLSNNQRDFRQPLNQFGISPQYKWMKFHAGYRNVTFSQFGLAGHTILGGGFELTPKKFRFSAMYGRTNKAVREDTTKIITQNLNSINYPAYKQMLLAVKLGVGSASNFVDLYFVKGKDDTLSLPEKPQNSEVLPSENLVIGLAHKFSFFKNKLEWQSEGATSAYTRDISAPLVDLSDVKQKKLIESILTPRVSTVVYTAVESQLKYKHKYFTIGTKYRRIDPDYKSMGAYFFQSDLEQITGNLSLRLFKGKLNITSSAGIQNDNIARKKLATTQRNIYSGVLNYTMNKHIGIDISVSNYGTAQRAGTKSLSDTTKINQISNSITVTPHYFFQKNNNSHAFVLIVGNQQLNDRNQFTSTNTEMEMLFTNFNYSFSNSIKKTTYNSGINYSKSTVSTGNIELAGITVGSGISWLKDKLNSDVSMMLNSTKYNGANNGFIYTFSTGNNYTLTKKQSLRLQLNWLLNKSKNSEAGYSFNEFTAMMQYRYNF